MRNKDKIEKYLDRLIKIHNGILIESEKSRYYSIRGRTLRVSDHVGINSGNISILLDNSDQGHYIIHGHTSGNISVLNYEQTKEFVRSFVQCSFIYADIGQAKPVLDFEKSEGITKEVYDYLKNTFSHKQLIQMSGFLKGEGKKRNKEYLEFQILL
jgi:hypothetical protein